MFDGLANHFLFQICQLISVGVVHAPRLPTRTALLPNNDEPP